MIAAKLDPQGNILEYTYSTLAQFGRNPLYSSHSEYTQESPFIWVFLDRPVFWSDEELYTFTIRPTTFAYDTSTGLLHDRQLY